MWRTGQGVKMSASKGLEERKAPHVPQDFQKMFENLPFGGKKVSSHTGLCAVETPSIEGKVSLR